MLLTLRVLNSYLSIRTAALCTSDRTTRPVATNCKGHTPPSLAGQFTLSSIVRPMGSFSSVVNKIPPLPMLRVVPQPVILVVLVCVTRYRTSSRTGNLLVPRRSRSPPPVALLQSVLIFIASYHGCLHGVAQ